ncbi:MULTISPECIES: CiaD-like domain-containing protein [Campylobacter]|uniref:Campylobacter invasion antigen D C-terminal domain-containing protein n=2 Tax=Campylobacter porcelli TaxID=1660073 RepID=A0ABU7M642_9BACT|nr:MULTISPECIES: hypothetical protein [unclassified Campylobacter]MCR8679090.1 hypothetical protein [Campylobacter sp. RM19072]MCR8696085.1 hypothetical protein [Campylobacter sp. RM19073]MEE3704660.1 hypothetical protein [Campylobacter sp. CX2-8023-23]MEE3744633.1 hypothetical protein [Campylobacter sp. CX2-4855-23]MEE3776358.1 hypothetical protein [Campylobacter sp. CX2-4080-23]
MRLEDIAKFTIDEVNAQLQGTSDAVAKNGFIVEEANGYSDFSKKEPIKSGINTAKELSNQPKFQSENITISKEPTTQNSSQIKEALAAKVASIDSMQTPKDLGSSEMLYLQGLKERIGILFEGLNSADESNLEFRLDMTIKFLEFALASIENRLSNISK